ncbi:hypothetical protein E1301_Tti021342 [Triplophysa tibetana]|uniref:Uncharacterized protein n=1 Tax=Triplophysa tibetana TaxID=1572043 RepID=A0A5A9PKA1_9TELE|nr:hypothetical protein E1301_Tti021342 [Triplophysa tibetana]
MTMRKFSRYPGCQVEAIRKCCSACYASLSKSKKTEAFKDRLDNEWGQGVWKNRNPARDVSSAQVAEIDALKPGSESCRATCSSEPCTPALQHRGKRRFPVWQHSSKQRTPAWQSCGEGHTPDWQCCKQWKKTIKRKTIVYQA